MNIIWVIRELCVGENGFKDLFDRGKSYEKLLNGADDKKDAALFASLLYGSARGTLLQLIHDVYHYETYAEIIVQELLADGMNAAEAKRALEIFYEAFGFPNYRRLDESKLGTVVTGDERFKTEYQGEVRDGKEHGVGARTCYYNGKWCNYDECVWVNGVMYGYDNAKEVEFGMFEDRKIGFVVNDYLIGKIRIFASSGEEFDDIGKTLDIR